MIEWSKIAPKLGDWAESFKPFYNVGGFETIYAKLKKDGLTNKVFPKGVDLFKAFELCPRKDLKCIIIAGEPYQEDVNDGLALSATTITPTLNCLWRGVELDISEGLNLEKIHFNDLSCWAKDGVLLLNSALTTVEGKRLEHIHLWVPFMEFFLESIKGISGIPIIFVGRQAETFAYLVDESMNYKKIVEHPAKAVGKSKEWEHGNMFSWINNILKQNNNLEIDWWQLPF